MSLDTNKKQRDPPPLLIDTNSQKNTIKVKENTHLCAFDMNICWPVK